ncbi:hypothetical protein [Massilia sp. MS-15]|uniref:hypothetical protein n=1 Tax=Massilia sp. MS-15 TaxID=2878200 RepID=UPI001CD3D6AE|nr:hypothetical protein [Massilia sp. MS-15]MCA1246602.1 hypothetical protein [Massilia sp. MS-15]
MLQLFLAVMRFLRHKLLLFLLILFALACLAWVRAQWLQVQEIAHQLPALRAAQASVDARRHDLTGEVAARADALRAAPAARLDAEIAALDASIARREVEGAAAASLGAVLESGSVAASLQAAALRATELEVRRQARTHLVQLRAYALAVGNREAARQRLDQLRQQHEAAYAAYQQAQAAWLRFRGEAGIAARIPLTPSHRRLVQLERARNTRAWESNAASQAVKAQQRLLAQVAAPGELPLLRIDARRVDAASAGLRARLQQAESFAANNLLWKLGLALRPLLLPALWILLGFLLAPLAIRSIFYFVLAPLAARRPAIVIDPRRPANPASPQAEHGRIAAVSLPVQLAAGDELLVRPEFCQSQSEGLQVSTRLLFDPRHWLTSMAAQLWMLKRLRAAHPAQLVLSSTLDPYDEVALVTIRAGEALVLQPRCIVAALCPGGRRPRIRSHWRLASLHAWLTLQLRYLAFEGPATLAVKGCRGVRLESVEAGRSISQDATLGFSAHARYRTLRAEPFYPYLAGRQALFHDEVAGEGAHVLYEEVPRSAQAGKRARNPVEVLVDACLKAFGI